MEYHDQPLQYINRNYFHTKTKGDDHYDVIFNIITLMGFLPLALWIGFIVLAVYYIFPEIRSLLIKLSLARFEILMKKLNKAEDKDIQVAEDDESKNNKQEVYVVELKSDVHEGELSEMVRNNRVYVRRVKNEDNKYRIDLSASRKVDEIPLLCFSIFLNGALLAFHILSAVDIIQYGNDVLQDHNGITVSTVTLSLMVIVVTYILAVVRSVYEFHKGGFDNRSLVAAKSVEVKKALNFRTLAAMSITVNVVHLVCYFLPYMLLAFIFNPLQTCFTYLALGFLFLCVYLLFLIFTHCCISCTQFSDTHTDDFFAFYKTPRYRTPRHKTLRTSDSHDQAGGENNIMFRFKIICKAIAYSLLIIGILLVAIYFSAIFIYVLILGSLNDFEVIQNLVPPLLIGILTYLVVKPIYNQAKQKINLDDGSRIDHKENTKEDAQSDNNGTDQHIKITCV